jgi:hypothetical protein
VLGPDTLFARKTRYFINAALSVISKNLMPTFLSIN